MFDVLLCGYRIDKKLYLKIFGSRLFTYLKSHGHNIVRLRLHFLFPHQTSLFKKVTLCVCMCLGAYIGHMCAGARRSPDALELGLQVAVSCPTRALGSDGSSAGAARTLKSWAVSPAPLPSALNGIHVIQGVSKVDSGYRLRVCISNQLWSHTNVNHTWRHKNPHHTAKFPSFLLSDPVCLRPAWSTHMEGSVAM